MNGVLNEESRKAFLQILNGIYLTSEKIDDVVHLKIKQNGKNSK